MEVNINIGDRGMLYIPIKKKNITIHINPEKWDVCEFVEEINPAMVYLLLEKKLVHPTFRVMRQSCRAYSLRVKYRSSLNPYALRFITFILLLIPSTFPVET